MGRIAKPDGSGVIHYYGLLVAGRRLERRARWAGVLDALRNVRSDDPDQTQRLKGEPRRDGFYWVRGEEDWYPPFVGQTAAWELSTHEALEAKRAEELGACDARLERLRAQKQEALPDQAAAANRRREPAAAAGNAAADDESENGALRAARPAAQARRRARAAEARLAALQADLAEGDAERDAVEARFDAHQRQVAALRDSIQHRYWAARLRWSLGKHSPRPTPIYVRPIRTEGGVRQPQVTAASDGPTNGIPEVL